MNASDKRSSLNAALRDPSLSVMNFLNEVKINFPDAISFSAGRPAEAFFDLRARIAKFERFLAHECETRGMEEETLLGLLGQYGRTNGIIGPHLAAQLRNDENIEATADDIVVTTGCQEAMALVLIGLFDPAEDVLLCADPTYIGITGLAALLGIEIEPVHCDDAGLDLADLDRAVADIKARGKVAKAVYVIPDFNNPLGSDMKVEARRALLQSASRHDLWVFEDNPYGMFTYDSEPAPTLKSLDTEERVIYLGTFSKTLFPSLRVGYLVTGATIQNNGKEEKLTEAFSKIKSLTTVNTSGLVQAMIGGILIDSGHSLKQLVEPLVNYYRANRDTMLSALEKAFPGNENHGVTWNRPGGGFFMTVNLPFEFDDQALEQCAGDHGVIVVPMSYFAMRKGREHQIRLSFCSNTLEEIERGVGQLAQFIRKRIGTPDRQ